MHPSAIGEVGLALPHERGEDPGQQPVDLLQEVRGLGVGEHVVAHRGIEPAERPQLLDPERIGQEAAVEDQVDIEREAELVAEGHHRGLHGRGAALVAERLDDPRAQLVRVQLSGVDEQIGLVAHGRQQPPLVGDRLLHPTGGQRMAAAGALVAPDEDVVAGIEEEDPHPVPVGPQRGQDLGQLVEVLRPRPGR